MFDTDTVAGEGRDGTGAVDKCTGERRDLERSNSGATEPGSTSSSAMQGIVSCRRAAAVAIPSEEEEALVAISGAGGTSESVWSPGNSSAGTTSSRTKLPLHPAERASGTSRRLAATTSRCFLTSERKVRVIVAKPNLCSPVD